MDRLWFRPPAAWFGLVLLLLVPTHDVMAERDIYRCVYPDGQIEFRAVRAMDAECTHIGYRQQESDEPGPASDPMAGDQRPSSTEAAEPADPRVRNCEIAQENLEMLESSVPVVVTGPDGEPALLSEDDRAERLRKTRRDVDYWCEGEDTGPR